MQQSPFTPENKIPNPAGDLIKVANPDESNQVLDNANMLIGDSAVRGNSLDNYIMMIMDEFTMAGEKISVSLIGHGRPGAIQLGNDLLDSTTKSTFVEGVKGKIDMLTLFGCCVASGDEGADFVQWLANELRIPVMAYTDKIGVAKNITGVMDGFYVEGGIDAKITFVPIPEPSSIVGLLIFGSLGASSVVKRRVYTKLHSKG